MIDQAELYANLKERLSKAVSSALSVSGPKTLKVHKVWVDDPLDPNDIGSQLDAKMNGRSWAAPVYADISLVDAQGKEIDRSKKLRVMEIPKLTPRLSFIVDGEEFQVANQMRLKPGVYVKSRPEGTSAAFKLPIGYSKFNHSIDFSPSDRRWLVSIDGKSVPLYSYLRAVGLEDLEISEAMGPEELDRIRADADLKRDVAKLRTVLTSEKANPQELGENSAKVREILEALPMSPDVPKLKYGKTYKNFGKGLVIDALKNTTRVLAGDEDPDMDSSRFKEFRTFDEILTERIEKGSKGIQGRIKLRMRDKSTVREVVQPDKLSDVVSSFFNRSALSNYPSQSNPINYATGFTKTTVFGEGSIGNKRAVTKEERDIDPSAFGAIDPTHSPEGGDIGAVSHVAVSARKGEGSLLVPLVDLKTQKVVDIPHPEIYGKRVAFPGEYKRNAAGKLVPIDDSIRIMHRGKVRTVGPSEVDMVLEHSASLFDMSSNLVPFFNAMHGGRGLMAAKMADQAVGLKEAEAPLVRTTMIPGDKRATFEEFAADPSMSRSPADGTVESVTDRAITIKGADGKKHVAQIYKDFPLNARSFITSTPRVKPGDKVSKGDLLADSNFSKDGTLAVGRNLKVAWIPARGWNYEDGIVISESAAKKLTSEHMYKLDHRPGRDGLAGRDKYAAYFPSRFTAAQLAKLDESGVVKEGQRVSSGDPVAVHLSKKNVTPEDVVLGKISRNLVRPYGDSATTWEEPFEGTVIRVEKLAGGAAKIHVKTEEPMQVGDKLVSRYAAKGLVTRILPDHEMPQTKGGEAMEILLNPVGLPTRMNPGQIYEALAGKIAEKTGKPYLVSNFERVDYRDQIADELKKHGLDDADELFDPVTGRSLGKVTNGRQFIMKLEHASKEKFSAREPGGAYTADLRPAKSGDGAQSIGHMEMSALMSHGALHNIRDMATVKAGKSDEFWRAVQANEPLPPPQPTFAFDKFVSLLKGAGINVERRGTKFQLKPLTDEQTQAMSAGQITSSRMLLGKDLSPEKGGLFDEQATGGLLGKKWSHVELPYAIPNPIFEPAIKGALGLTQREFDAIIGEQVHVDPFGRKADPDKGGMTGPAALKRMLASIDIPKAIRALKERARTSKGSDLNSVNRALRFLINMKEGGISADDLFVSKIPVLPPSLRPVYPLADGTLNVSDANYLYRDLVAMRNQVAELSGKVPDEFVREQRAELYQAAKAVVGVGEPISSGNYRGIVDIVTGEHPKGSYYHSRVLKKQQELSGRAVIVGDPTLGMDEVGIPEDMAWVVYKPFIVQKLVSGGVTPLEAESLVKSRSGNAREALAMVMSERPAILNRAPTLHKHGILAMKPSLVPGKSIRLNNLVTTGFGADYDGDAMAVHIPVTPEAVREAYDMFPSANPMSTSEKILVTPRHEAQVGLYRLTEAGRKTGKAFPSELEALEAFHDGEIVETDVIKVGTVETTVGRILVNKALPEKLRRPDLLMDKGMTTKILESIARENPKILAPTVDALKGVGNEYAYLSGLSVRLEDLGIPKAKMDQVLGKYDAQAREAAKSIKNEKALDRRITEIYAKAYEELKGVASAHMKGSRSSLGQMIDSGGRGDLNQATQMIGAPILVEDIRGRINPHAVRTGYAQGMSPADYWVSALGSRRGSVETKLSTAEPGALTKSMVQTSIENRIVPGATPETERGLEFSVDDREAAGRYIMKDYPGLAKRGDLFEAQMREKFRAAGRRSVELGSPLTSTHPYGTYALSYGLDERGRAPKPGAFIGITASQAIGEPMTQLVLGSKHVQGVTSKSSGQMTGFEKLRTLMTMPQDLKAKAVVAKERGVVESVRKVTGGHEIRVSGKTYFTPFDPVVRQGKAVNPGDVLSEGLVDPRDILETRGIDQTRRYLVDEVYGIFGGSVRKKHIETVVRSATDTALVTDSGGRTDLVEGDVVPINVVRAENRKNAVPVSLDLARNAMLMEEIDELGGIDRVLTDEDVAKLRAMGRTKVIANPNPVRFAPVLKGVDIAPMARKDWMANLSFRKLKDTLGKAVAEGWKSDVRGWNPVPGIAYGAHIADSAKDPAAP